MRSSFFNFFLKVGYSSREHTCSGTEFINKEEEWTVDLDGI